MKSFKKTLILLCTLCALVLSAAIAACGGGKPVLSFEMNGAEEIPSITADAGTDISALLPEEPTREGYFFEGWYADAEFSQWTELPTVMPEESKTYYAKWTEGAGAKLTLTTSDGGILERTQFNVKVGDNLLAFLADKAPTPKTGLTFAGWYRGANAVTVGDTMPAAGVTLTAKYKATYSVEVYRQEADGSYEKDGETVTGEAFYGEAFSCLDLVSVPEHFFAESGADGRTRTDRLDVDETFKVYLSRDISYVYYEANAPQGVTVSGTTPMTPYIYGANPVLDYCGFTLQGSYRFIGWALTSEVTEREELLAPDTEYVTENNAVILFAIWEKGYADVLGGADVLYPDMFAEGTLHLEREGLPLKEGTLEGDRFQFKEGDDVYLSGRLLDDDLFFYYREDYNKIYTDMDKTAATLKMKTGGAVEYTDKDGKTHTGSYTINSDGYFVFDADEGQGEDFIYNLYTAADGDEQIVFRRQNLDEEGYYYDENAGIVLYLDGLSGLRYYYTDKNYVYTDFSGAPVYMAFGYYEYKPESGLFLAYTRDITAILSQFTFKTEAGGKVPTEEFPDLPAEAQIDGTLTLDDHLRGTYGDKWGSTDKLLDLNGYGNGTYGEDAGTYTVFTWLYSYEEENEVTIDDYYLVRFVNSETGSIYYFRMDADYGDFEIDRDEITAAEAAKYTGVTGRFDLTNELFVLNITLNPEGGKEPAFIFIFENGNAEVWSHDGSTMRGDSYFMCDEALISSVELQPDNSYKFLQSVNEATGEAYLNEFTFTVDAAQHTATVTLPEEHVIVLVGTVDGKQLRLDYTARQAYFGETYSEENEVQYGYTIGYYDLYYFYTGENRNDYTMFWTKTGQHSDFHLIDRSDVYEVNLSAIEEESLYYSMLYFPDGSEISGDHHITAYIAFQLNSGMYRFVGTGTVEAEGDDYLFTLAQRLPDLDDDDLTGYTHFQFRLYDDQTFRRYNEGLSFSNFVPDGYGMHTYTDAAGTPHRGVIVETIGEEGSGMLITFLYEDGVTEVYLTVDNDTNRVVAVTQDYGYWYEINSNGLISVDRYLLFDGRGNAYYFEYDPYGGVETTEGTYRRSSAYRGETSSDPFFEYIVTMNGEETYYLLGVYEVYDPYSGGKSQLPLYQARIAHRVGSFTVRGGGTIESDGYPNMAATYTDARGTKYQGNMYIGNISDDYRGHDFENNVDGKQVRFWVYDAQGNATSTEFLFDIAEDGTLVPYTLPYGGYALYVNDLISETEMLQLHGRGTATLTRDGRELEGTYELIRGTSEYMFKADGLEFRFRLTTVSADGDTYYVFERKADEGGYTLLNAEDWSVLVLDGYGDAHYINRYGDRIIGTYALFGGTVGAFESASLSDVFDISEGGYTFRGYNKYAAAYYAEDFAAVVFTPTRVTLGDEEYFYTVSGDTVTLYTLENYAKSTISLPNGDTYTYKNTAYRKYEGDELTFTDSTSYKTPVSLKFTPNGAAFSVTATFADITSGYRVVTQYTDGEVRTLLTYLGSAMDSRVETYALELHYTGTENTFSVKSAGRGTYTRQGDAQAQDTIVIAGGRIGAYNVKLPDAPGLKITLNSVKDSSGAALTFTGELDAIRTEDEASFSYGNIRAIDIEGEDGKTYTFRFFLIEASGDGAGGEFILSSVVLEKTFTFDTNKKVTMRQLWVAGTSYAGAKQKAIVQVNMERSSTEENFFTGALDADTAAVVRQIQNTTTGGMSYQAYVFKLTFDGDGFLTGADKDGNYLYGEARQGIRYTVRFLYTRSDSDFEVKYLLTFSENDRSVPATFEKTQEKNVWTITATANKKSYKATISRNGSAFALKIEENP